jgi:hypothetical protein
VCVKRHVMSLYAHKPRSTSSPTGGIGLRVGLIDLGDGQRTGVTQRELVELGS